ncbi:helix-turn-helix domain-containing protein [Halomarina ordinaria]|uniref:Helix-turn-helix domain-containing protein n=1 Tax=Halomarina ordinaria TaxID=3033939 RepID=A0ABD5U6H7_9EURY|nr:helix-turn-helix domain-containing protein [Halomarina sp. PSRA2]
MRELTFAIEYDPGADPIMDVFAAYPSLTAHSLDGVIAADQFWRIERFSGPAAALSRIEEVRFDDDTCGEAITETRCGAARFHDTLERSTNGLVLYTHLDAIRGCESVHTLAGTHLPSGVIFQTRRRGSAHWWRLLMRSDDRIGVFYDDLSARLREGLSFRMGHLRDADGWRQESLAGTALSEPQERALRAAVAAGYYDPPRETTLDDIAADLGIPRSTLSYRLRRAESALLHGYVDDTTPDRWLE